jgi:uncharacterized protein GlcG (DUF336 family)
LEDRLFLSAYAAVLGPGSSSFAFIDADGDQVSVQLIGPGSAAIRLDHAGLNNADIDSIALRGANSHTQLTLTTSQQHGAGTTAVRSLHTKNLGQLTLHGNIHLNNADIHGSLGSLTASSTSPDSTQNFVLRLRAARHIGDIAIDGNLAAGSILAAGHNIQSLQVNGDATDSTILAGAGLDPSFSLTSARVKPATINLANIRGNFTDSILAAGGNPGPDGRFQQGEVLPGGQIHRLRINGRIHGENSTHDNPGIYAASLGSVSVAGQTLTPSMIASGQGASGNAVLDPLPTPANALTTNDIKNIHEHAIARARQLGVNATIALLDREGNILSIIRTTDPAFSPATTFVNIQAGGAGGLEEADQIIPTSLIAATKAGTAAFLSTSQGNAFTTRTAGYIIQTHFPPGIEFQDSGPLFGVQLSSLPTSDVNRLPLGLSADPGGIPLYRGGELLGGLGVETDGTYTVVSQRIGRKPRPTVEESIALAGQIGFQPPPKRHAGTILRDGIRLPDTYGKPPHPASLGALPDYDDLVTATTLTELVAPQISPSTKFAPGALSRINTPGVILGEIPNNSLVDFFDDASGNPVFLDGDLNAGQQLTAADTATILTQAHQGNERLRSQIRRNRPQISQVTASVVDLNGNLLGSFRTPDAPLFGYDVSVQKARSSAFFSRPDAAAQLRNLDTDLAPSIALIQTLPSTASTKIINPTVNNPFGRYADAAQSIGVMLDGSIALANRTIGFLSRHTLPDGIPNHRPTPFTALTPDSPSPFNTGLQTTLLLPNLIDFLLDFNALGETAGLAALIAGTLGGPSVVPNTPSAGIGLPGKSLANGLQIFSGSVPLYKNGVLVGAVGVSGDGTEQDDFVAFSGAKGFQDFGPNVQRPDHLKILENIRLPYVKFPRSPFGGF